MMYAHLPSTVVHPTTCLYDAGSTRSMSDVPFATALRRFRHSAHAPVLQVLLSGISCLSLNIDLHAKKPAGSPGLSSEIKTARAALSMHVFLLKWIATLSEKHAGDVVPGQENKAPTRKGAKKGAAARIVETWNWDQQRPKLLNTLKNVLQGDIWVLWRPGNPDEQFINAFLAVAFAALESPTGAKDKDTRAGASAIATRCVSALAQQLNVSTAVMNLLTNNLHASLPAAELVAAAVAGGSANEAAFVAEVMNEIGRLPMTELARDTGLAKNFAAFVCDLSEAAPSVVLAHMSVLHPHLQQGESYTMRNAILHAIGNGDFSPPTRQPRCASPAQITLRASPQTHLPRAGSSRGARRHGPPRALRDRAQGAREPL